MAKENQMKTYRIQLAYDQFFSFMIPNAELGAKMPHFSPRFRAKPKLDQWVNVDAKFYAADNYMPDKPIIPDITTWATGNLVLGPKAYDALGRSLELSGEFLPVSVEGVDYYMLNTLKVIPESAIDRSRAKEVIDAGVNMGVTNVAFDTGQLDGAMVFKTPTDHCLHSYCTEEFKQLVEEFGLTGVEFEEVSVE